MNFKLRKKSNNSRPVSWKSKDSNSDIRMECKAELKNLAKPSREVLEHLKAGFAAKYKQA